MQWTKEQQTIIDHRQGNVLVSAAAGSGKTAVLVQRILEWVIIDGKNIDEFLVVTFTRAAASQMKQKIRTALERIQEEQPDNQHVIKQMSLIHRANITTIDSFCKQIVDENFQVLGIDPSMRIMDETEGKLMQEDVLSRVLEEAYEKNPEAMLELHQYMNDIRSNENIRGLLRRIQQQAESFPYPKLWLEQAREDVQVLETDSLEQQPWMQMLVADVKNLMEPMRQVPEQICQEYLQLETEFRPKSYDKYCIYFAEECRLIEAVCQAETYSQLTAAFDNSGRVYKRFSWKNSGVPESHYITEVWEGYHALKKKASEMVRIPFSEIQEQQKAVAPVLLTILDLEEQFMKAFQQEKQKKNCMDFSDVEHYALQVLQIEERDQWKPSEVAEQLQSTYVEILIDEYQDSNDLQEAILTSVARQDADGYCNLFMVGDMKQSIYKFRMARPKLFLNKYQTYSPDLEAEGNSKMIELKRNFRSRNTVLESVNILFYQLMTKTYGGMDYTEQVALVPGREFKEQESEADYRTEIVFLDMTSDEQAAEEEIAKEVGKEQITKLEETDGNESENLEQINKLEWEARYVAKRVRQLCDAKESLPIWDEAMQAYRPCQYKDIVILLRTVKGQAEVFRQVFMDAGIPIHAETSKGYFDSVEVKNLLCMLAVIDNAQDDIALAGVLRSPFVTVSNEELAYIRSYRKRGNLWKAVQHYRALEDGKTELHEKLEHFLIKLEQWKKQKTYSTIRELIWSILNETGYFEYVGAMPSGERRQGNILKLIEKASAYENTSYRGLFDFLRYIERMKITEQDFGEAVVLGSNDNLVRVMSIHKSKGLEFPVVFLCGCGKQFNQRDAEDTVLVDADGYLGVNYKHLEEHYYERTVKRNALANHMKNENLAEELRILYVAMTRAQEKLIMTGVVDAKMRKKESEFRAIDGYSYLTWFAACLEQLKHTGKEHDWLIYNIQRREDLDATVLEEVEQLQTKEMIWEQRLQGVSQETTRKELEQRFTWCYAYPMAAVKKGKLSVSEIKKMSQLIDEEESKSMKTANRTIWSEASGGAAYGTLIHLVMEKIDFQKMDSLEQVEKGLQILKETGVLTESDLEQVSAQMIYNMMNSQLGVRMAQAEVRGELYREQQFVIGIPMNQVYPEVEETDLELVQGIIDAYFEEDGELVLMDYKTDRVSQKNGAEELIQKYRTQLQYYKRTLEQLTGKTVKEVYLYSFCLEEAIRLPME